MLEKMDDFFTARVGIYDEHMKNEVEGCREGYQLMAELLPSSCRTLLDLGCGTGLELDAIFPRFPGLAVTGIDLTAAMLDALRAKHPQKNLTLICGSYFDVDFGTEAFDAAVSFQSMHHFTHEKKLGLYRRLWAALKPGGVYLECDYMVEEQAEEDLYFRENKRLRAEQHISEEEFYHYDTPCTIENQLSLLRRAGFSTVERVWRQENTTMLAARKQPDAGLTQ